MYLKEYLQSRLQGVINKLENNTTYSNDIRERIGHHSDRTQHYFFFFFINKSGHNFPLRRNGGFSGSEWVASSAIRGLE